MSNFEKKEPSFFGTISNLFVTAEKAAVRKVDHVLVAFQSAIGDLEQVASEHLGQAALHAREIEKRTEAKLEAEAEAVRASSIAKKMKAIFE